MSQDTITIANGAGSAVRAALNLALARLATNSSGNTRPADILAQQMWIDTNTPSATVWAVFFWDGTHDVKIGEIDSNTGYFMPFVNGISATSKFGGVSVTPQGRLTLSSTAPVMTTDATAQTTVYYLPYTGQMVPVYDGTQLVNQLLGSSGINLALDSNSGHTGYHQSGKLFDLFAFLNAGVLTLGTGPAWSSSTARGTGAGTTELQQLSGIWTNKNSITLKFDATSSTASVAANQATYLGTMYATANGQTGMAFMPTAASGGTNNILGLWNAYNRIRVDALSRDSTASWTYATATYRSANASASNRISWIDGLQQSSVFASYQDEVSVSGGNTAQITLALDGTSGVTGNTVARSASASALTIANNDRFGPQLGFHFLQAIEFASGATATFTGSGILQGLRVSLEM